MKARAAIAVIAGEPVPETAQALAALGPLVARIVVVGPATRGDELAVLAAEESVLWLPPWAIVDPPLAEAIAAWLGSPGDRPRVALVALELVVGDGALALPRAVLLSTPGAVRLRGDEVQPQSTAGSAFLPQRLRLRPPESLSAHLLAINEQTSGAARRLAEAGAEPGWRALALGPSLFFLRALALARGSRRRLLPRAVLEAYRRCLVMAKLWEIRFAAEGERG